MKSLRHAPEFVMLAARILQLADGKKIVFSPARGNWGDGLINFGTRQFFDYFHIPYEEANKRETQRLIAEDFFDDRVVVIGGGGAWSRNFALSKQETVRLAPRARHVVVLPTTFDLAPVESENVTYFTRGKFESLDSNPQAQFCHDMALFTEVDVTSPEDRVWRIFAMRNDREGHGYGELFTNNIDLSMLGDGDYQFVQPFFNILNNFQVVSTDRLHVAIVAGMLDRQVNLIPGNYSKSVDVFRSSLDEVYPRIKLRNIDVVVAWYKGKS